MKFIAARINSIDPTIYGSRASLKIDCDIPSGNYDDLLGEICEQIGDDAFMEWVRINILDEGE